MRQSAPLALLTVAVLAGCASSQAGDAGASSDGRTVRVVGTTGTSEMRVTPSASSNTVKIDLPFANVWKALPEVYEQVGIPITTVSVGTSTIANDGMKLRRRLKDVPLGRYIDCGSTQGMPSAETYDIFMTVRTQLAPVEGGTTARTTLEARARPASIAGDYITCSSTGRLEERIGQMLGGKPPR